MLLSQNLILLTWETPLLPQQPSVLPRQLGSGCDLLHSEAGRQVGRWASVHVTAQAGRQRQHEGKPVSKGAQHEWPAVNLLLPAANQGS